MKQKNSIAEWSEIIFLALILALFIRAFITQAYKIPSGSMLETLQIGDYLFISKLSYGIKVPFTNKEIIRFGDPEHGDIIVFDYPADTSQNYIKRVIGIPGDVIEIRDKQIYRNGKRILEPYVRFLYPQSRVPGWDIKAAFTVPEDKYFVLGDNRDMSKDSRDWGFVPRSYIHGKAWRIFFSIDGWSHIRWERIGRNLFPDERITGQ